jgi:hypothetical protein
MIPVAKGVVFKRDTTNYKGVSSTSQVKIDNRLQFFENDFNYGRIYSILSFQLR